MSQSKLFTMRLYKLLPALFTTLLLASLPAAAQLKPTEPDPLARIRDAAAADVQACSVFGETLCEQVAPKIIANAQGDSPLGKNLQNLRAALATKNQTIEVESATAWAMAAFREAGLDPHLEKYPDPDGSAGEQQSVVAEYRGRESPDEWVLVGAHLAPQSTSPNAIDHSCDAASVIEAARDISVTAMHPKRSVRFVLFTGDERHMSGSWAYVRAHRSELDHARAAIIFDSGCFRVTEYSINGRPEIEPGLREAMKPVESLGAIRFVDGSTIGGDDFDFFLEGISALSASPSLTKVSVDSPQPPRRSEQMELDDVKHNISVVAVTSFGIAERTAPIGPRQTRVEIEASLKMMRLDSLMKDYGMFSQWESGQRGRLP